MTRKERLEYVAAQYRTGDLREMCKTLGVRMSTLYSTANALGLRRDMDAANRARSAGMARLYESERRKMRWGLERRTSIHIPTRRYSAQETNLRHRCAKKRNYIPGDYRLPEERFVIFYDTDTRRSAVAERHGKRLGFRFEELKEEGGGA